MKPGYRKGIVTRRIRRILFTVGIVTIVSAGYFYISYSHLSPRVRAKEQRLATALRQAGYKPNYWLISGYRPPWLNRLMPLSVPKSDHKRGLAIDLWVGDVNQDWKWTDADLRIVTDALDRIDDRNPKNRGGLGRYQNLAWRMVHFDVSGRRRHWGF